MARLPPMKVWIVTAERGEYSDRSFWIDSVHMTEEPARERVRKHKEIVREIDARSKYAGPSSGFGVPRGVVEAARLDAHARKVAALKEFGYTQGEYETTLEVEEEEAT